MATRKKKLAKKKAVSKSKVEVSLYTHTQCKDCKIQLVVKTAEANCCGLCNSLNITKQPWR
jgi:hypothetical protein